MVVDTNIKSSDILRKNMENSTLFKETCNDNKQRINIQKDTREIISLKKKK